MAFGYGYTNSYGYNILKVSTVRKHKPLSPKLQITSHKL